MYKLYSATVELTRKCNARCKHCIVDALYEKENELSTERILKLIEELHDEGCEDITFTGGEPFLREEWPLFVQKARSLNMNVVMMTNGLKINDAIIEYSLEKIRDEKICNLSIEEKYILSLIRLTFRKLDLLIIDNIFDKLSDVYLEIIADIVKKIKEKDTTLLLATTNEKIANMFCKRKVYFKDGSIVSGLD